MSTARFEPAIPASERPQTYALDLTVTASAEMFLRDHEKRFLSSLVSGFTFLCSIRSVAMGRGSAVRITTS